MLEKQSRRRRLRAVVAARLQTKLFSGSDRSTYRQSHSPQGESKRASQTGPNLVLFRSTDVIADGPAVPDKLDVALLRIAGVCALACVMAIVDSTVVAVAQRAFVAEFRSSQAIVSWTMAAYMLALATVIPITGWAADRFGTKRLFMGAVLSFTVGSLLCVLAPNIWLLILSRIIQGFGGGVLLPLTLTIMTREAGPKRIGRLIALGGIPILLGPIGGPILGGWLIGAYGWKWMFLINVPIGLVLFALAAILFPSDSSSPSETLDIVGVLLLSPGVAMLLAGISSIPVRGRMADRCVLIPAMMGLICIVAFSWHAWRRSGHPLIDLRLLKNRAVAQANVTLLLFAAVFLGTGLMLPSYFQVALHESPMQSGIRLVPQGLGAVLSMSLTGVLMDKYAPAKIVIVGLYMMAGGLGIFTLGVAQRAEYQPTLLTGLVIMGLGIGCATTALTTAGVQSLAPHEIARGSTLLSVNQQIGGSIGVGLMAAILTSRLNRNHSVVAGNVAPVHQHTNGSQVMVDSSAIPREPMSAILSTELSRNASYAFTEVFVLASVLVVCTIIPAVFLPGKPIDKP